MMEHSIQQNAVLISQRSAGGGGPTTVPIIANKTVNNQNSDTVLAASAITVNPESSLKASARNVFDDAIL